MKKIIYLDNASTMRTYKEVAELMKVALFEDYGNPSSSHSLGESALTLINEARRTMAREISARDNEIIFTSGATESNNLSVSGINVKKILVSKIEHDSVWSAAMEAGKKKDIKVIEIPTDREGFVDLEFIKKNADEKSLVSVIHGSNEIGTLQDLKRIGEICNSKRAIFHSDCSQSFGKERINVREMKVDLISASGHKIGASKGVGFLFVRDGIKIKPMIFGGGQEGGRRAGTENVPGIAGFGRALELIKKENVKKMKNLRNYFIAELEKIGGKINGNKEKRLPNNVNVTFKGINSELMVLKLSEMGIMCSTGSACNEKNEKEKRVLKAIGLDDSQAKGTIRFSLGFDTSKEDIDYVLRICKNELKNNFYILS